MQYLGGKAARLRLRVCGAIRLEARGRTGGDAGGAANTGTGEGEAGGSVVLSRCLTVRYTSV